MRKLLDQIENNFEENIATVEKLMKFDELVQDLCLRAMEKARKGLENFNFHNHPSFDIKPLIGQVKNIRQNKSLKPSYEIMFNQCVVLLVSYFGSAIEDIFREALKNKIENRKLGSLENQEIKLTMGQLVYDKDIVDLFISKRGISFQDMQSIARAFEQYIEIDKILHDKVVNNIILSQTCRHCIVHYGSIANKKVIDQLRSANSRDLKPDLKINDKILFDENEIEIITANMKQYIKSLINQLAG